MVSVPSLLSPTFCISHSSLRQDSGDLQWGCVTVTGLCHPNRSWSQDRESCRNACEMPNHPLTGVCALSNPSGACSYFWLS